MLQIIEMLPHVASSILIYLPTVTMHQPLVPGTNILNTITPNILTFPMVQSIYPVTLIVRLVLPLVDTKSTFLSEFHLSTVDGPVLKCLLTFSMGLIIFPTACVDLSPLVRVLAVSVFFGIYEVTLVKGAVWMILSPLSMWLTINPKAFINFSRFLHIFSISITLISFEWPLILMTISISQRALTLHHIIIKISFVHLPILSSQFSHAMFFPLFLASILGNNTWCILLLLS